MIMVKTFMLNTSGSHSLTRYLVVNLVATLILSFSQPTLAQTVVKNFASAEQASQALYEAVRNKDDQALRAILGDPELSSSGDEERDKLEREQFVQKYEEMHRLVREPDGSTVLYVGAENWPFTVPLVSTDGSWHFDADAGTQEAVAREVGENESTAIEVCRTASAVKSAETPNATAGNPVVEFAHTLVGSENATSGSGKPFHGYYFRVLKQRSGETTLVAYPTEYRSSGVMTFIANENTVYEQDLGPQTASAAEQLQGKPKGKWNRVQ